MMSTTSKKYDEAFEFASNIKDDTSSSKELMDTQEEIDRVYRKVDYRILSILCGIYFLQFLDKSLLNYAAVMGIKKNLHGNEFSNLATILYCSYIVFEPISAYCFQVLPPAKFFAFCVTCWGIVVTMHIFCETYASLMVIRMLLGIFEACVAPGCILLTGMWWNQKQQLRRMGLWSIQAGTSTILGGLLSFAFQHVHSDVKHLGSWQIFFLMMGIITVIFGVIVWVFLPDNPLTASFLTEREKAIVVENIRSNQTGTENKVFKKEQIYELIFKDKHTWPMLLLTVLSQVATGAIGTFSVTIISTFGFSPKESALMQMPVGASTIISIIGGTYIAAYFKGRYRNLVFISMLVPAIIGYIVMLSTTNKIGNIRSVYLINVGTCVITMIYSWNGANTAGHTKRLARNCLTMIAFAVGALIGPQLFRAQDYPHYRPAKIILLVFSVVCIPLVLLILQLSRQENQRRDLDSGLAEWVSEVGPNHEFMDMTDVENRTFRYSY